VLELRLSNDTRLRLMEESDAEEIYSLIESCRPYLGEWMPWADAQTLDGTRQFIRLTRRQFADNNGFQSAIVKDGAIVGVIGFHAVDWVNRVTSIGYWLGADHQGAGTMTEAVRAMVDHAFNAWKLNRVEIRAAPGNARSRAIPERLGFVEEGTLREAERIGDRFLDNVLYATLASSWKGS
jgi:ribosomal-protein-serine acetyltransferase